MNRLLVIVVLILVPITIVTYNNETETVLKGNTLENISLEIPVKNEEEPKVVIEDSKPTVLVSNNKDKSNPYTIDLEEYIIGVVAGEMPASFNMEALKAQAVASRTYAMYKMKNLNNYVLSTTINDQVYLNIEQMKSKWGNDFDYYYNRVKSAVDATKGQVITYNDNLIIAYYFAISNGYTDNATNVFNENKSYLVSVDSKWDRNYSFYSSTRTMIKANFCSKLGISCDAINITNVSRDTNHYVRNITINGKTFSGREVFNKLGLKSHDFEINVNADNIIIKTLGFGHGVGMSQYGAQGMAKDGYTYENILKHYYQNTEISKL